MTKQEEIKKAIDDYTDNRCLYPDRVCNAFGSGYCPSQDETYLCLIEKLTEKGIVIKVERELPGNAYGKGKYKSILLPMEAFAEGQSSLLKAGYVAVEPLIKEA